MICPYCQTDNRDDREACYYCEKDLTMLRLIVNKAKHHYNQALEFAERGHNAEAIAELKNTLELDGTMVNAQVVLGTLYAKQEQFEEARACWTRALEIDHRFNKAHEYLEKARNAEYVYPGMRRLLRLCALLGLGLAGLGVAAVMFAIPDPGLKMIHEAGSLLGGEEIHSGDAVERLGEIQSRSDVSGQLGETARFLGTAIDKHWRDLLSLGDAALRNGQPMLALESVSRLEAQQPSADVRRQAEEQRQHALATLQADVRRSADAYYAGTGDYETFRTQAEALLAHQRDEAQRGELQQLFDAVGEDNARRQLAQARRAVGEEALGEAIEQAAAFEARNPGLAAEITALLDQRLAAETTATQKLARAAIDDKEWEQARGQIDALAAAYQQAGRPAPAAVLDPLRAALHKGRSAEARRAAQALFAKKDWEGYLDATADPATLARDEADIAAIELQRGEARTAWAAAEWSWFERNAARFESGRISPDDAARAVRNHARVAESLGEKLESARPALLFAAAAAHVKLEQFAPARELVARLQAEYPESKIVETTLPKFIERHEELQATEPEPAELKPAEPEQIEAESAETETSPEAGETKPAPTAEDEDDSKTEKAGKSDKADKADKSEE